MRYEEPQIYSQEDIKRIMSSGTKDEIIQMLVGVAFNEHNLDIAYNIICKYLDNQDPEVLGVAIICLAHLTRIHGQIPIDKTVNIIRSIIRSPNGDTFEVKSRIHDAATDFSVYQPELFSMLIKEFPEYYRELGFEIE